MDNWVDMEWAVWYIEYMGYGDVDNDQPTQTINKKGGIKMEVTERIESLLAYIEQRADEFENMYYKSGFIATELSLMRGYLQALLDANEISEHIFNKYLNDLCTISAESILKSL